MPGFDCFDYFQAYIVVATNSLLEAVAHYVYFFVFHALHFLYVSCCFGI